MKIAVIGTGALGCLFGANFSKQNEVILITHSEKTAETINHNGLYVKDDNEEKHYQENLKAYAGGRYDDIVDIMVILVKTTQTEEALEQNKKMIGENTLVVTLQNGLGNYEKISKYVNSEHLILGTTSHNSVLLEAGRVYHSGSGITAIGGKQVKAEDIKKVFDMFSSSGFECVISDNIGNLLWKKLFVNLTINSFTYITLTPIGFISQNDYAKKYVEKIIEEAVSVAGAEGYQFDKNDIMANIEYISETHLMGYSSMSQDRKRGAKTEIDAINGAVVSLAQKHNIATPYNEMAVTMVHAIEAGDAYNRSLES